MKTQTVILAALLYVGFSFGAGHSQTPPAFGWVKGFGGEGYESGNSVTTDNVGNCYVTGRFSETIVLGDDTLTSAGFSDIFILKTDNNGNVLWAKQAGGSGDDYANAIATDLYGNIVVTGIFSNTAVFDSEVLTSSGSSDIFLAKYSGNGELLWLRQAGGSDFAEGNDIGIDFYNHVILVGAFFGTTTFESPPNVNTIESAGGADIFIARYSSVGSLQWARRTGSFQEDRANSISVAPDGDFVVTGTFSSEVNFGNETLLGFGYNDAFIAKYNIYGSNVWAANLGALGFSYGRGVTFDLSENVILTGGFSQFFVFGSDTLFSTSPDSGDMFVAKFDAGGQPVWAKVAGSLGHDEGRAVTINDSNEIILGGYFEAAANFDQQEITNGGGADIFLANLNNTDGSINWIKQSSGASYELLSDVTVDIFGNYLFSGYHSGASFSNAVFDTLSLIGMGSSDIIVGKLGTNIGLQENIILSVEKKNAFTGDTTALNVYVFFPADSLFNSLEIGLINFHEGLDFLEIVPESGLIGAAGWEYEVNDTDTLLSIAAAGVNPISGQGSLFQLSFAVENDSAWFFPVDVDTAIFDTGAISVQSNNGGIDVALRPHYGDVDRNGLVQAFDASIILKHLVTFYPFGPWEELNGDVSLDNTISTVDAKIILQYVVGKIDTLPYPEFAGNSIAFAEINFSNYTTNENGLIEIPINYDNAKNILGYNGTISYDSRNLKFVELQDNSRSEYFVTNVIEEDGLLHFAAIGDVSESGSFATLLLEAKNSEAKGTVVSLKKIRLNENQMMEDIAEIVIGDEIVSVDENAKIEKFSLYQNYPNPFNPRTNIRYDIAKATSVKIKVYNVSGQVVDVLVDRKHNPGSYAVSWNAANVGSGVYFYKIETDFFTDIKKVLLIK